MSPNSLICWEPIAIIDVKNAEEILWKPEPRRETNVVICTRTGELEMKIPRKERRAVEPVPIRERTWKILLITEMTLAMSLSWSVTDENSPRRGTLMFVLRISMELGKEPLFSVKPRRLLSLCCHS